MQALFGEAVNPSLSVFGTVADKHGKKGSLMCWFYSFPHRLPVEAPTEDGDKSWMRDIHVFTVLRKEDISPETCDMIWDVLAWDLAALATGLDGEGQIHEALGGGSRFP